MASSVRKISILGTGNMGRALGLRFAAVGHSVFFAGRDPSGAPRRAAQKAGGSTCFGTLDEAAEFGDVFVWTARERELLKVLSSAKAAAKLDGKIIIDLNNRDYAEGVVGPEDSRWFDTSLGEVLQANAPKVRVVKAFNTVAMEALDTSADSLQKTGAQIFLAGDDDDARTVVRGLAAELGFESVDLGRGRVAMRAAEALGDVIRFVMIEGRQGGRANICIRTLEKPDLNLVGERETTQYH